MSNPPNVLTQEMTTLRATFAKALSEFAASSSSTFRVLHTYPPPATKKIASTSPPAATKTLIVLDSSFNPPSRAHRALARSAFEAHSSPASQVPSASLKAHQRGNGGSARAKRKILFLLATQNADKAPQPAEFADRVVMMEMMARELYGELRRTQSLGDDTSSGKNEGKNTETFTLDDQETTKETENENEDISIDIGIVSKPYFVDKALAIDHSGIYGPSGQVEQVHLVGFDTLLRIFDKKYYPEVGVTAALEPFLSRHRIRGLFRVEEEEEDDDSALGKDGGEDGNGNGKRKGGKWGDRKEQEEWLERVRRGEREGDGLKREWAERVELVDGGEEVRGVSSTKVREAVDKGDWEGVEALVGRDVTVWIWENGLYTG